MKTCGYKKYLGWAFSFLLFSRFLSSLFLLPSPFLCRLEFISNQRASREPQLLITYSFAFLHINDCRVLVRFLPQWFKGTSVLCSLGKSRDVQRQGSKPVQSPLYPPWWELDGASRWENGGAGGWPEAYGTGGVWWFGGEETTGVHRLKVNVPYQHKKEHMSSAPPNCCHIEQFKHLIWTKYTLRETGNLYCRDPSRGFYWGRQLVGMKLMSHSVQRQGHFISQEKGV